MNREETHALWRQGKNAWNAWAAKMLAERAAMKEAGTWTADKRVGGRTLRPDAATRAWLAAATADFSTAESPFRFEREATFDEWVFPGPVLFEAAAFCVACRFNAATFSGQVSFRGAVFSHEAWFCGASFSEAALYDKASFAATALFSDVKFLNVASFRAAAFSGPASFISTWFSGEARFNKVAMAGIANFDKATFRGAAWFDEAAFSQAARFGGASFSDTAQFDRASFASGVSFDGARFFRPARFFKVKFSNDATFKGTKFFGSAQFGEAGFDANAYFSDTTFARSTGFVQARFAAAGFFNKATFLSDAEFAGITAHSIFSLEGAGFRVVPSFIQAHFIESPRLDGVDIGRPERAKDKANARPEAEHGIARASLRPSEDAARWRALRRLAAQGHDHERELQFFADEIRAARGATDLALPWPVWSATAWRSTARWWWGFAYEVASDFGRSLLGPFLLWLAVTLLSAGYFLTQRPIAPEITPETTGFPHPTVRSWAAPCSTSTPAANADGPHLSDTTPDARMPTNAPTEALRFALSNAFVVLDSGADASHRTFGCLYGFARQGANPIAVVPSSVSLAATLQKAISAALIFLFCLGVRNMLRMR